jgi:hypothetical protein
MTGKNILSISGGGCRGVIVCNILKDLEEKSGKHIAEIFDFFTGSSVGSLITCIFLVSDDGIKPKYNASEIFENIKKFGKEVFSNTWKYRVKNLWGMLGSAYPNDNLKKFLIDKVGDKKIKELLKPFVFPCFDLNSQKPIYFTREEHGELYIRDVIMACCSAPTYFPPYDLKIGNTDYKLIDSGITVNNPSQIGLLYATKDMNVIIKDHIFELCLGTGDCVLIPVTSYGTFGWMSSILGYLFKAYNDNEMHELSLSLNPSNFLYTHINIDQKYDDLDKASDEYYNYYLSVSNKWLEDNRSVFDNFVCKLLLNHGLQKINNSQTDNNINEPSNLSNSVLLKLQKINSCDTIVEDLDNLINN